MTEKETEQEGYFTVATYSSPDTDKNTLGISKEREDELIAHIVKTALTLSLLESITLTSAHARSVAELWYIAGMWITLQSSLRPSSRPIHIDSNDLLGS